MPFTATVLTMFPEAFPGPLGVSLIGSAWREAGLWRLETVDIRDFSLDKRGFLDDTPAGGGPGQVMRADVIASALDSVEVRARPLLYMSARGRPLTQARVSEWSKTDTFQAKVEWQASHDLVVGIWLGERPSAMRPSWQ